MLNIVSLFVVFAIVFSLYHHAEVSHEHEQTSDRSKTSRRVHLKNKPVKDKATEKWPSFDKTSYHFILGFFRQRKFSLLTTPEERAMFMIAILLSQEKNITLNGKPFAYRLEETNGRNVIDTLDRTCLSITENQILGIVGPTGSNDAKTIARFGNRTGLPVLGYSITDPDMSDRNAYPTFYRMSTSDMITAQALLKLFQKYKWNSTNIIYQGDHYGQGGLHAITEAFKGTIKISRKIKYDLFTDRIEDFRHKLENSPSRIVLIWATSDITMKIIQSAINEGDILAPSFLWILTATNSRMQLNDKQLAGMLLIRSVSPETFDVPINKTLLKDAIDIWKTYDPQSYRGDEKQIDSYALYAFDSAWLLMTALAQLCEQTPSHCPSLVNTSHCFAGELTHRTELHKIMQTINFLGVSGYVQFRENTTDRLVQDGPYFIIDNLQPSRGNIDELHTVEVLKLDGSTIDANRWGEPQWIESGKPILWPRGFDRIPVDYASPEGKTLNITVYVSPPFYMEKIHSHSNGTNVTEQHGYIFDLISLLEQRMKFRKNIIVAPMKTTYNELVDLVENGTYDIVMADLTQTSERSERIDFSTPIYDNIMRLIVRKSTTMTIPLMGFLKPFEWSLWLGIFFIIYLLSAICIAIFEFFNTGTPIKSNSLVASQNSLTDATTVVADSQTGHNSAIGYIYHSSPKRVFFRSMYYTISDLLQRGSEYQARTIYGRFQTIIVWTMSVILMTLFTSGMIEFFIAEREKPWIESIDDLKMCGKIGCSRIGIVADSHHADYFTKELTNDIEMSYYRLEHPQEVYGRLLDNYIDVAIADSSSADYFTQTQYCDLEVAGLPFGKTYFGVAMRKQWLYKDDLNTNIMSLKADSAINDLQVKWFQQKNCDRQDETKTKVFGDGLTFVQTRGLFIVFGSFTVLNILLFILSKVLTSKRGHDFLDGIMNRFNMGPSRAPDRPTADPTVNNQSQQQQTIVDQVPSRTQL